MIDVPAPGESFPFAVRGMPVRAGAQTSATVTLLIDPDFDGELDFTVAQATLAVPSL